MKSFREYAQPIGARITQKAHFESPPASGAGICGRRNRAPMVFVGLRQLAIFARSGEACRSCVRALDRGATYMDEWRSAKAEAAR